MWAYITDFLVVTLLTVLFHVLLWLYSRDTFHVHMHLLCTPFGFIYALAGVANNPGFSCPDPGVWTLVAWLELIRVRSGSSRGGQSCRHSSSSQYLPYLAPEAFLLLVSTSLLLYTSSCIMYSCTLWSVSYTHLTLPTIYSV